MRAKPLRCLEQDRALPAMKHNNLDLAYVFLDRNALINVVA